LRILSDIYVASDRQEVTLLGPLDPSAAFDCVNYDILLRRLAQSFDIGFTVLTYRHQVILAKSYTLYRPTQKHATMVFGVTQGSVLVPLLFLLYTASASSASA